MKTKRIVLAGLVTTAFLFLPSSEQTQTFSCAASAEPETAVLAEFHFDAADGPVLKVPVAVGNNQYRFALATGDSSLFGKQFAKLLARLPPELDVPDAASLNIFFRSAPQASVGALNLHFPYSFVQCGYLDSFGDHYVHNDGVIGLDVLAQHIVQIDFDEGKIRFLRSIPKDVGDRFDITSLQKKPRLCAVTVKAQCCGEPAEDFYVELESLDEISVRAPVYQRLFNKQQIRRLHSESTIDSRRMGSGFVGRADSFGLGRFRTKNVRAVVSGDNTIGLGYLSRYLVTFDFPKACMYLRPGKQFEKEEGFDFSGLHVRWRKNALEVGCCKSGSPADVAGLQSYDVILKVDEQPVNLENQSHLWRKLRQEGSTLRIQFKRGELRLNADLKLDAAPGMIIEKANSDPDALIPNSDFGFQPREPRELPEVDELSEDPRNASREGTPSGTGLPVPLKTEQRIVVTAEQTKLQFPDDTVGSIPMGTILTVREATQDSFRVMYSGGNGTKTGWVSRRDVIPVEAALAYFSDEVRRNPTANLYYCRGTVRKERRDYDAALDDYNAAIRLDPSMPAAWRHRGIVQCKIGAYDNSIADLDESIRLAPDAADTYVVRALAWGKKGDHDKSLADSNEAIRLDPQNALAFNNRGIHKANKGDNDLAIADFTEAIRLDPDFASPYISRGVAWHVKRDYDKAIADFDAAARIDPGRGMTYFDRAAACFHKGDYGQSVADYSTYLRANGNDVRALHVLALICAACPNEKCRDGKRAVKLATRACELSGWKEADFLNTLAAAYAECGDFEKAVEWQEKALEITSNENKDRYQSRLELYKSGKPYRFKPPKLNSASE